MYFIVYKTTCKIDNKEYIGCHKTAIIEDGYLGSGKLLQRAIKKYGLENFEREVIAIFDNKVDMLALEKTLVNESFVNDPNTYNLKVGGEGGWDHVDHTMRFVGKSHTLEVREKIRQASLGRKLSKNVREKIGDVHRGKVVTEETRAKIAQYRKSVTQTEETKQKISKTLLGIQHKVVECPHCKKTGGQRAMKRWHFDNCKSK